jgi:hypothetical protein
LSVRLAALAAVAGLATMIVGVSAAVVSATEAPRLVDAVLAEVEAQVITASDVAVARALGALGFAPSADPIDDRDADRMIRVRVALAEADRLGIDAAAEDVDRAWLATRERITGLEAWLEATGVSPDWARSVVASDARLRKFVDVRFGAFAFVGEDELDAAGAGRDPSERQRVRERLRAEKAERELNTWLDDELRRTSIRRALGAGSRVPCPLPMP